MQAIDLLCQGTMRAAAELMFTSPKFPKVRAERVSNPERVNEIITGALRQTLKCEMKGILAEWKDATDARMGNGILQALMTAQCLKVALDALTIVEEEL